MWSFRIHETTSGKPLLEVDPSAGSWRRAMGAGSGSHTLQMKDADGGWTPALSKQISEPNATTLAVCWLGAPLYAGLVQRAVYARDAGVMTLSHDEGFRTLLRDRNTFGVGGYPTGDLIVANKSASGVVRAILERAMSIHGVSSRGELPVDLPADGPGPYSFAWKNFEWHRLDDLLVQVEKLGYEIDFEPYYDANGWLRWTTRVAAKLTASLVEFPVTVEKSAVTELVMTRDGAMQISGCFYLGRGSEADMVWGQSTPAIMGTIIPVRDAVRSAKDVGDAEKLRQMSVADRDAHREPIVQWDFKLTCDEGDDGKATADFRQLRIGATLRLGVYGDPVIPDGAHDMRLVGLSGDMGNTVTPEVQPA